MARGIHIVFQRGLLGGAPVGYSFGLDTLMAKARKLSPLVTGKVFDHDQDDAALQDALAAAKRGDIIVEGGHSLGALSCVQNTVRLANQKVPVALVFLFDSTWNAPAPAIPWNVSRAVAFYGTSWFSPLGHDRIEPGAGFKGFLSNIPVAALHQNVDDDLGAHSMFLREISWLLDPRAGSAVAPAPVKTAPVKIPVPIYQPSFDPGNQPSGH